MDNGESKRIQDGLLFLYWLQQAFDCVNSCQNEEYIKTNRQARTFDYSSEAPLQCTRSSYINRIWRNQAVQNQEGCEIKMHIILIFVQLHSKYIIRWQAWRDYSQDQNWRSKCKYLIYAGSTTLLSGFFYVVSLQFQT